jgi:hypothetical protein
MNGTRAKRLIEQAGFIADSNLLGAVKLFPTEAAARRFLRRERRKAGPRLDTPEERVQHLRGGPAFDF